MRGVEGREESGHGYAPTELWCILVNEFQILPERLEMQESSLFEDCVPANGGAGLSELESADLCVSSVFLLCAWGFLFTIPGLSQVSAGIRRASPEDAIRQNGALGLGLLFCPLCPHLGLLLGPHLAPEL